MNFSDRNHFSRKSDPTYRNKKHKEAPVSDNMDSIQNIKRKGASLARPDLNRQNSLGVNNREYSKRISVFESTKYDGGNHSGGTKIMNFIKSSLNLTKSKSKSKLNINDGQQMLFNQNISSKSDDQLNVLPDDNSYQIVKSANLVLKAKDNTLYLKEYSNNKEFNLKSLTVLDNQCIIQTLHPSLTNHQNFCFQILRKEPTIDIKKPFSSLFVGSLQTTQIAKSISFNSSFSSLKPESADPDSVINIRCISQPEMNEWITKIRQRINPNYENSTRHEDLLQIWIQEAKQLIQKKRYYCEIKLDEIVYGRTMIKTMTDTVFWGEEFEFRGLQNINKITICLYKMTDNKKKHERSELVAQIEVLCSELTDSTLFEKWYSPQIRNSNFQLSQSELPNSQKVKLDELLKNAIDFAPTIRIKGRYRPLEILPNRFYDSLSDFLVKQSIPLVESLESHLKVKSKEDFVKILLVILKNHDSHISFLADLVSIEVSKAEDNLILRGNSIASKAMECYLKMVGEKYLVSLLKDLINEVILDEIDCEVDPLRLSNTKEISQIHDNQSTLLRLVENVWSKIYHNSHLIPNELKLVFTKIREKLSETKRVSSYSSPMIYQVISSCLFLRFICPAIMSPFLFGLSNEYPDNVSINRTFTLIAKSIQSLANFSQFPQSKETYMEFMQNFINKNSSSMRSFLKQISMNKPNGAKSIENQDILNLLMETENSSNSPPKEDRYADIGYHLAELMFQLNIYFKDIPEMEYTPTLIKARTIIENIAKSSVHGESDNESDSSNISNFNGVASRIPMLISKMDKTTNNSSKSVIRIQSQNLTRPLSLVKQKSEIEENFSYIPTKEIENKDPSDERLTRFNNGNYVDFEHFENNPIYDEPCHEYVAAKSPYITNYLNEEEINDDWSKMVKECNNTSVNSNNSLLEDPSNYTQNSSGYQTLANISPDYFENSTIQNPNSYDYIHIENSDTTLASSLPVKLSASKSSPIHQKLAYKRIKKESHLVKKTSYYSVDLKTSQNIMSPKDVSGIPNAFCVSHETLGSSENLSETENLTIPASKSFQVIYQKKSGSNNNLHSLNLEKSISTSHDSIEDSLSSKTKLKSRSSQSFQNIFSTNIDLDPLISNEWKRIKLLMKIFYVPKPSQYQGSVIEQYKQRTIDENLLELFLRKKFQFNDSDIIDYLPAAYRLLKSVHKNGKLTTDLLTQYLMHANHRIQMSLISKHLSEVNREPNESKTSISKKIRISKAHRDFSNLSSHSLPFPITKYSK